MEYQFDQDLPEYVNDFFQYLDNEVFTTKEKKEEQKMNITVEVKRDKGSNETPNYFIEYNCNGYNSGINSSRADFWAICDESSLIWINKDKLKIISERYGYKWEGRTEGGCSPIKAYLVPKHYILEHSELVTKLPLSS